MMGDQPWLNFTGIEQLDLKVGKSCPQCCYICGKRFTANTGIGIGIAEGAVFSESGDKRVSIATVPGIVIAASYFGGFHCCC